MSDHTYESWRHGGWYVLDVRYPSGAVGCVSRNYADRKWRIVCDDHERTYPNRDAAADAEAEIAANRCTSHTEQRHACGLNRGHEGLHHDHSVSWDTDGECEGESVYPNGQRLECYTCTRYLARVS